MQASCRQHVWLPKHQTHLTISTGVHDSLQSSLNLLQGCDTVVTDVTQQAGKGVDLKILHEPKKMMLALIALLQTRYTGIG